MRIPDFFKKRFKPTMRVDVFDQFSEKKTGQDAIKIAEVTSDGYDGQVKVLEPRFQEHLTDLFTKPQFVREGAGGLDTDGVRIDGELRALEPFQRETLQHVISVELANHNFRGQLFELSPLVD